MTDYFGDSESYDSIEDRSRPQGDDGEHNLREDERQAQQDDYAEAMGIIQRAVRECLHRPMTVVEAATIAGFCGIGGLDSDPFGFLEVR
jgi:hypothetical protein